MSAQQDPIAVLHYGPGGSASPAWIREMVAMESEPEPTELPLPALQEAA